MANIYDRAKAVVVTGAIVTGIVGAVNDLRSVDITGNKGYTESKGSEITNTVGDVSFNDLEDYVNTHSENGEKESEIPSDAGTEVSGSPSEDEGNDTKDEKGENRVSGEAGSSPRSSMDALGITDLQRENAKEYRPPETGDGYVAHEGFVPSDTQIMVDEVKDSDEKARLEKDLDLENENDTSFDFKYDDVYSDKDREELNEANDKYSQTEEPEIAEMDVHQVPEGTMLSRYTRAEINQDNPDRGTYLTTEGTEREKLSLSNSEDYKYRTDYKVIKPFDAHTGVASAANGQEGGGDQIVPTDKMTISDLEKGGFIEEVGKATQDENGNWVEQKIEPKFEQKEESKEKDGMSDEGMKSVDVMPKLDDDVLKDAQAQLTTEKTDGGEEIS